MVERQYSGRRRQPGQGCPAYGGNPAQTPGRTARLWRGSRCFCPRRRGLGSSRGLRPGDRAGNADRTRGSHASARGRAAGLALVMNELGKWIVDGAVTVVRGTEADSDVTAAQHETFVEPADFIEDT